MRTGWAPDEQHELAEACSTKAELFIVQIEKSMDGWMDGWMDR